MTPSPTSSRGQKPLHTVQVLGSATTETGAHVRSLAEGLVARGVRVTVCSPTGVELRFGFTTSGAGFVPLPVPGQLEAAMTLRTVSADADLVHAHGLRAGLLATIALSGRRGRRVPLVVTWHTRAHPQGVRARLNRLLERRVLRAAEVVLGASSDLVERARRRGARDARLAPVAGLPQSRDRGTIGPRSEGTRVPRLPPPREARAELGALERPLVFAMGRMEPHQGHDVLLTAARAWRRLDPQPLVVIAGEGSERAALQERVETEALPVQLLDSDSAASVSTARGVLAAADVAVLPARWAARSPFAQEALHAGVPLVATDVGGVHELVGPAAELVPYGDPDALAAAVEALLANPARRAQLTQQGRARAATWPTEDGTVNQVLGVYDELAQTNGR